MLDILTVVHSFADVRTASRIRRTCRRLAVLIPQPTVCRPDRAIVYEYRVGSILHRLDGPAREYVTGDKIWCRGGIAHREYHPQYTGKRCRGYMVNDVRHREAGPSILYRHVADWYLRGMRHRKVGPADTSLGVWYTMGKWHRLDGPACAETYLIRGIVHNISGPVNGTWKVADTVIR